MRNNVHCSVCRRVADGPRVRLQSPSHDARGLGNSDANRVHDQHQPPITEVFSRADHKLGLMYAERVSVSSWSLSFKGRC